MQKIKKGTTRSTAMSLAVLVIVLSTFFLTVGSASAFVELAIEDAACLKPAGASLTISNSGDDDLKAADIVVKANFFATAGIGQDVRGADQSYLFPLTGNFSQPIIEKGGGEADFTSENNILSYPGKYKVHLIYKNCKPQYQKCEALAEVACPGLKPYGCDAIPLKIDSCKNEDSMMKLTFHNVKEGLFTEVDMIKDFSYTFYGESTHIENDLPKDTKIVDAGDDTYLLSFGTNGAVFKRVKLEYNICGTVDYANCKLTSAMNVTASGEKEENTTVQPSVETPAPEGKDYSLAYILSILVVAVIIAIVYKVRKVSI